MTSKQPSDLPTHLETSQLILRCYQPGDGPMYLQVGQRNREHLQDFEPDNEIRKLTNEEQAEILIGELVGAWTARTWFMWGVFEKATGDFAAQVTVGKEDPDIADFAVGYFADKDHEGRGYVSEAVRAVLSFIFEDLHAPRASLHCSSANLRSQHVAERCGFILDHRTPGDHHAPDGSLADSLHYRMLSEEYERIKSHNTAGG